VTRGTKAALALYCASFGALALLAFLRYEPPLIQVAYPIQGVGPVAVGTPPDASLAAATRDPQHVPPPDDGGHGTDAPSLQANPEAANGGPQAVSGSLGVLNLLHASEEYHPTRERFMALAGSIHFALDASPDELADAGPGPWQKFDLESLRRELLPERELEALWTLPDTQALWRLHQEQFLAQSNLLILLDMPSTPSVREALEKELEATRGRLDDLRLSIWNDPAYQALYLLAKELR